MYFSKDQGIIATHRDLQAVLQFCGSEGPSSFVGMSVRCGELTVRAYNGLAAVYHRGDALDGKGGRYDGAHRWGVAAELLACAAKSIKGSSEELVLCHDVDGSLSSAIVREISSGKPIAKFDLAGQVDGQMPMFEDDVPEPNPGARALQRFCVGAQATAMVGKVCRACSGAQRWVIPTEDRLPIYVEVDTEERLGDGERPAWLVEFMPLRFADVDAESPERQAANRILSEQRAAE